MVHMMRRITRSRFTRRWLFGIVSFLCTMLLVACSVDKPSNQAAPDGPVATPVLKVAISPAFAPFEIKAADGTLTGFDIDLINAIGGSAGFIIDFDEMTFDDLIRNLHAGKVDAAISAITVNRDRAAQVSFSQPYFKSGLAIAVPMNNTEITSLESLRGKRIGVQQGTTGQAKAESIPDAKIQATTQVPEVLTALKNGQVDAVINDAPVTAYAVSSGSVTGIKIVTPLLTEEFYGIATPKNSPHLEKINAGLATILANGTYAQIYKKWFAADPPKLPEAAPI